MRLEITVRAGCAINCANCPQELFKTKYYGEKMMSMDTFKTCIDKVPPEARIDWSGFCEPFFNPDVTEMMNYARNHKQTLFTTLMGLTKEKWGKIEDIEWEEIIIHIPDAQGMAVFEPNAEMLAIIQPTAYHVHGTPRNDVIGMLRNAPVWNELHNRAGNLQSGIARYKSGAVKCGYTGLEIDHNVLLPNGDVVMCCMDFGLTHVLGNLLDQTWDEIRNGEPLKKLREEMQSEKDCICNHCYRGI